MAAEERRGYRRWLIHRVLPVAAAVEWAQLCAASVSHLRNNESPTAAYWATEAAYWATKATSAAAIAAAVAAEAAAVAAKAAAVAAKAAYRATEAAYRTAEAADEATLEVRDGGSVIPSVYSLALPFLEAM